MSDKKIIIKVDADQQSFAKANTLVNSLTGNLRELVEVAKQANEALSQGVSGGGGRGGGRGRGGGGSGGVGGGSGGGGFGSSITKPITEQASAIKSLAGASRDTLRSLTQTLKNEMGEQQRVLDTYTRTISQLNQKMSELKKSGSWHSKEGILVQSELDAAYGEQAAVRRNAARTRRKFDRVGYLGNMMYGANYVDSPEPPDNWTGDTSYNTIQGIHGRPPWWQRAPSANAMRNIGIGTAAAYGLSRLAGGAQSAFDVYQSTKTMSSRFDAPGARGMHMPAMAGLNGDFKYAYALQAATLNGRPLRDTLLEESIGQGAAYGSQAAGIAGDLLSAAGAAGTTWLGVQVGGGILKNVARVGGKSLAKIFPGTALAANALSIGAAGVAAEPYLASAYGRIEEMRNGKPAAVEWDTFNQNTQNAIQNGLTDQGQMPFAAMDLLQKERDMRISGARDLLDEGGANAVHGLGFLATGRGSNIQEAVEIARAASRSNGGYGVSGIGGVVDRVLTLQRTGMSRGASLGTLGALGSLQAYGSTAFRGAASGAGTSAAMRGIYGGAEGALSAGLGNLVYGNRVSGAVQDQFGQALGGIASAGDFYSASSQNNLSLFLSNAIKGTANGGNVMPSDVNSVMSGLGGLAAGASNGGLANLGALRALNMTGDLYSSRVLSKLTSSPEGIAELLSAKGNLRGSTLTADMGRKYLGEQLGTRLSFARAPKEVEDLLSRSGGNVFDAYKNANSNDLKKSLAESLGTLDEFGTTRAAEAALKAGSATNTGDVRSLTKKYESAAAEARKGNDGAAEAIQRLQEELQNAVRELSGFTKKVHEMRTGELIELLKKPADEGTKLRPGQVYQVQVVGFGQSRK